jgi:EVE domain
MNKHWIAVASAEHVRVGRGAGFMQVCHGKAAPLRRVLPGDCVAYYSPTTQFGGHDKLQAFTALGVVKAGEPYAADMGNGFCPFRRDVLWRDTVDASIKPLLPRLSFSAGVRNWGYALRFGLFAVTADDMALIAAAMAVKLPGHGPAPQAVRQALLM